ncbi:shikimate kinase [Bizionia sediminis]|uniref:Shikimate kinase n=1 Tax=Bizionia sediminis TaxID=1737064 RepID=A0ABW5KVV4_9FLAO
MKIIIFGYMTSGKSLIGPKLAQKLEVPFYDLDQFIEANENMSVSEIFQTKGELYFRKKEHSYLPAFLQQPDGVYALGGGTPCYGSNLDIIKAQENAKTVYLNVSVAQLGQRLFHNKAERPLVAHLGTQAAVTEFVGKHLFERLSYYNQADYSINANGTPEETLTQLLKLLG